MIRYLYTRLDEDTTQEAVGGHLQLGILKKNPDNISGMCVEVTAPQKMPQIIANRFISGFLCRQSRSISMRSCMELQSITGDRRFMLQ